MNNYLQFWGVRGSYPTPFISHMEVGGNTSCIALKINDHYFICDAGTGLIPLGQELIRQNQNKFHLLITHYHWDHISGLPFFVPAFMADKEICLFGPGKDSHQIEERISGQMKAPYFPVETENWLANIHYLSPHSTSINFNDVHITPFVVHHPGTTFGFNFQFNHKKIVYMPDNEFAFLDKSINEQLKNAKNDQEKQLLLDLKQEYKQQSLDHIQNADILIHDSQYTMEDYQKKRGWGHSCYIETVEMAISANVKCLYLFHLDPSYDDTKVKLIHKHALEIIADHKSDLVCHIAREGLQVPL